MKRSPKPSLKPSLLLIGGALPLLLAGCGGGHRHSRATPSPVASGGQCPGGIDNTPFAGTYSGTYFYANSGEDTTGFALSRNGRLTLQVNSDGTAQGTISPGEANATAVTGTTTVSGNQQTFTVNGTLTDGAGGTATVQMRGNYRIDACVPKVEGEITVTEKGTPHTYYFQAGRGTLQNG